MMISKLRKSRGFTLVELMIVVAIIGVLAALAIYGVRKYIANAKTAEARTGIGRMAKDASSAYNKEGMAASVLDLGGTAGINNKLCVKAADPVPKLATAIKGQKYQSKPEDWSAGDQDTGFRCLGFSMTDPQYFQYSYDGPATVAAAGAVDATFAAGAAGDLDSDGNLSSFILRGRIQEGTGTDKSLVLTIAPNIEETNPEE